ncbi:hypothetical protein Peur_034887 [Populus x canadensis]
MDKQWSQSYMFLSDLDASLSVIRMVDGLRKLMDGNEWRLLQDMWRLFTPISISWNAVKPEMFSEKKTNLLMIDCLIKLQGLGAYFKFIQSLPSANLPTACIQLFRESV